MHLIQSVLLFLGSLLRWIWKFFHTGVTVITNLLMLSLVVFILFLVFHQPGVDVPGNSALVLAPRGVIVEQPTMIDPVNRLASRLLGGSIREETLLQDIIDAIHAAADDARIKMLVLATDAIQEMRLDQIKAVGAALERFKQSDKVIVAVGERYNQGQYYLASWADEIYLDPMGGVDLHGFGVFQIYMRDMLEKLEVDFNVFRAGEYKSAMEPFTRNDMSPSAEEASRYWLGNIWQDYCGEIASHRGLNPDFLTEAINGLSERLTAAEGDRARMATGMGLIDGVKSRQEIETYLAGLVGSDPKKGFRQVHFQDYLGTLTPSYTDPADEEGLIGIIVAEGSIVPGTGTMQQIGADTLISQIREARQNDRLKALVLRLDSGGGSAFASEQIRQELLRLQDSGKPVVVSMGSKAASGGYWLAADARHIVASPATLTGSIGVFGALPTFGRTLERIGVHGDGVGTTDLADMGNPTRAMTPMEKQLLQQDVDQIYKRFLDIVAQGRKLNRQTVEKLAQGRVWDGRSALEKGLVDELGTLETAVIAAARFSGVSEENAIYLNLARSPLEAFYQRMEHQARTRLLQEYGISSQGAGLLHFMTQRFDFLIPIGDPGNVYAHSLLPGTPIAF